jgi:helix-turn-helix protein
MNLTSEQALILQWVNAEAVQLHQKAKNMVIESLIEKGLLKTVSLRDADWYGVKLTDKGRKVVNKIRRDLR